MANVRVLGYCPSCGQDKLTVAASGGAIVCHHFGCAEPTAVHDILRDREVQHIVTFTEDGWTLRHPLIERIDDRLVNCDVHEMLAELTQTDRLEPGRWRVSMLA
jgi:hypothetical protein